MTESENITNKDLLEQLMQAINVIKEEGKANKEELKQEIKAENSKVLKKLEEQANKINTLEKKCDSLEIRCTNLEKLYRKNNIIIFGLEIPNGSSLLNFTIGRLTELLGISLSDTEINNIYQLKSDKTPPVKVEFVSFLKKDLVIKNRKKLKGTRIFIAHDLNPEERKQQKELTTHLKLARSKNCIAKIKGKTLQINSEIYTLEQLRDIDIRQGNQKTPTSVSQIEYIQTSNSAPSTPSASKVFDFDFEHLTQQTKFTENISETVNKETAKKTITLTTPTGKETNTPPSGPIKEREKKKIVRTNSNTSTRNNITDRTTRQHCKQQTNIL